MPEVTENTAGATTEAGAEATAAKKTRAPKTHLLDIARGRLPIPFVHAIRFTEPAETGNADLAKKYGTSVGKVFDIRKGRNFGYVTKDYVFNADELNGARAWAHEAGNHGGNKEALIAFVDSQTVGAAEAVAAQAAAKPKKVMPPRKAKEAKADAPAAGAAEDLLS